MPRFVEANVAWSKRAMALDFLFNWGELSCPPEVVLFKIHDRITDIDPIRSILYPIKSTTDFSFSPSLDME